MCEYKVQYSLKYNTFFVSVILYTPCSSEGVRCFARTYRLRLHVLFRLKTYIPCWVPSAFTLLILAAFLLGLSGRDSLHRNVGMFLKYTALQLTWYFLKWNLKRDGEVSCLSFIQIHVSSTEYYVITSGSNISKAANLYFEGDRLDSTFLISLTFCRK
jgi:hypothetical protein